MRKTAIFLLLSLFSLIVIPLADRASTFQSSPGDQDKTIRLKSELVQLRAVVTDRHGRVVDGLKKEDFELLENDRLQEITFFSVESVPPERGNKSAPASARGLQQPPLRSIVLFVDTLHLTFVNLYRVKQAIKRFTDEQMTDRDSVALITTTSTLGSLEQFTYDRNLIRRALAKLTPWPGAALRESMLTPLLAANIMQGDRAAMALGIEIVRREDRLDVPSEDYMRARATEIITESAHRRKTMLSKLKAVADMAADMPGQRMIALFSEGFSLSSYGRSNDLADVRPAINSAARSGVVIYSIIAKGLEPVMVPASMPGIVEGRARIRRQPENTRRGRLENPNERVSLTSYQHLSYRELEEGLHALAKDTGGELLSNSNDLNSLLQKALDNNRVYYAIAYHAPDADSGDRKKFRRITLRVKNHSDYKVRTQKGYQTFEASAEAPPETPRQRLTQAIEAPFAANEIPVVAAADYLELEHDNAQASLQVYLDATALGHREQGQQHFFDLEIVTIAYDRTGRRISLNSNDVRGSFASGQLEEAKRNGYHYSERLSLKPGFYQFKVGVLEPATGRIGTATTWVEVPDLSRGLLTLSDIILVKNSVAGNTQPAEAPESMSPALTHGIRTYKRGETLDYLLKLYNTSGNGGQEPSAQMQTEILQSDYPVYQSQWRPVTSRAQGKRSKSIEVSGQLNLGNLQAGVYELRITVKDQKSKTGVQRVLLFAVES